MIFTRTLTNKETILNYNTSTINQEYLFVNMMKHPARFKTNFRCLIPRERQMCHLKLNRFFTFCTTTTSTTTRFTNIYTFITASSYYIFVTYIINGVSWLPYDLLLRFSRSIATVEGNRLHS